MDLNPVYATLADVSDMGFNESFLANIEQRVIEGCLSARAAYMASYFASQFTMPLLKWGGDIRQCNVILAVYDIMCRRGYNPEAPADTNLRDRFLDCVEWLKSIASGDLTPVVEDSSGNTKVPFAASSSQRGFSIRGTDRTAGPYEGD